MSAARYGLRGMGIGFLLGFAVLHYGCEQRSFEGSHYFVFNLMGAMVPALVGAVVGMLIGMMMGKK